MLVTLPNLELIVSVGAGVDHLLSDPSLPDVPVVRFVDPDLTARMVSYVAANVLYHHRRMIELRDRQHERIWDYLPEPLASELTIGFMGFGVLGQACAKAIAPIGYRLASWSQRPKSVDGVASYSGATGLDAFLSTTDILVVLLPLTPDTQGIINRKLLAKLHRPKVLPGPVLINAGRGKLQIEDDIIASLDSGELYAASLDVFSTEPLPATHPAWAHKSIVLTPHLPPKRSRVPSPATWWPRSHAGSAASRCPTWWIAPGAIEAHFRYRRCTRTLAAAVRIKVAVISTNEMAAPNGQLFCCANWP